MLPSVGLDYCHPPRRRLMKHSVNIASNIELTGQYFVICSSHCGRQQYLGQLHYFVFPVCPAISRLLSCHVGAWLSMTLHSGTEDGRVYSHLECQCLFLSFSVIRYCSEWAPQRLWTRADSTVMDSHGWRTTYCRRWFIFESQNGTLKGRFLSPYFWRYKAKRPLNFTAP
ncbi:uncharacterized protein BT62DRAFT_463803 [Guyanagaster necrorhizus]|uniref:Uncharacterized protein n=1 Tax=Guyanagaster necrorhizus TaxID=856835 RepID=A0A9P7VJQ3_9AGAR|nr:uncharacterized protein BT62DRAFT_463803 [Guyanagaster necrorhizus MCA 3950]KAG7441790.1 hypothetical protein BT62DRAFT_463803 [Guyanagaster necrorhizus MCA 3950]